MKSTENSFWKCCFVQVLGKYLCVLASIWSHFSLNSFNELLPFEWNRLLAFKSPKFRLLFYFIIYIFFSLSISLARSWSFIRIIYNDEIVLLSLSRCNEFVAVKIFQIEFVFGRKFTAETKKKNQKKREREWKSHVLYGFP